MSQGKIRGYTHIKTLEKEVLEMLAKGKTHQEVAVYFGFSDKFVVKSFVKRYNRKQRQLASGILLNRRGRPSKSLLPTEQAKDNEIKRLKMENELLRDFLRLAGRK